MSKNVEDIVRHAMEARRRMKAGLPVWDHEVNFMSAMRIDPDDFEARRDEIVRILNNCGWWLKKNDNLLDLIWELEHCETPNELDKLIHYMYDEADEDRVWIKTF
jgi:hypothetical protein